MNVSRPKRNSRRQSLTDQEIIAMCLQGNGEAWEELVRRYKRTIYSVPTRLGLQLADAADVFQSVCVLMLEHLHELKDEQRLPGWILTTTIRQCSKWARQQLPENDELTESWEDPGLSLEEVRLEMEMQQTIREAVDELPDRCRSLIRAFYLDGDSPRYEEISRELDIPIGSIAATRARCLEKLRIALRRRGLTWSAGTRNQRI